MPRCRAVWMPSPYTSFATTCEFSTRSTSTALNVSRWPLAVNPRRDPFTKSLTIMYLIAAMSAWAIILSISIVKISSAANICYKKGLNFHGTSIAASDSELVSMPPTFYRATTSSASLASKRSMRLRVIPRVFSVLVTSFNETLYTEIVRALFTCRCLGRNMGL
ncbi:MAG: hypothetical protein ACI9P7_000667 [Candidatus Azotimanducaceae bacterium]|jgi:hypothetical protein